MRVLALISFLCAAMQCGRSQAQVTGPGMKEAMRLDSLFMVTSEDSPNEALTVAEDLLQAAKRMDADTLLIRAYQHRASALGTLGIFDAALKDLLVAYRLAEAGAHIGHQVRLGQLIGQTFQSFSDYGKSTDYLRTAHRLCLAHGIGDTLGIVMELGFNMAATGNTEGGLRLLHACLDAALAAKDEDIIISVLDNIGNIHFELGDYATALAYILREADYPQAISSNYNKTVYYEHLAEIYVKMGDWKNAERVLDSSCHYAHLIASNDWLFECHKLRTEVEAAKGNHAAALAHHRLYVELKDSVYQQSYANTFAAMTTLHEVENKENAIRSLEMEKGLQEERLRKVALQRNGMVALAVLVAVIAYLLFRSVQQRREARMKEKFSGELIQEQENERQRISRELHDNIGQYLLFIRNKLSRGSGDGGPDPLLETVDTALTEVRALSKELYPNQLERYGLEASIQLLFDNLRSGSDLIATCDLAEVGPALGKEQQLGVFRIVQESLSNTMKYAGATAFRVEGRRAGKQAEFVVQDNGKGAHQAMLDKEKHRSFGLLNIEERIRLLGGKHQFSTHPGAGFKLTFTLPL